MELLLEAKLSLNISHNQMYIYLTKYVMFNVFRG